MKPIIALLLCGSFLYQLPAQNAADAPNRSVDHIVQALYEVISGPAGPRDWDKFRNLFHTDAYMGVLRTDSTGRASLRKITPAEYIQRNGEVFMKNDFFEKELHRQTLDYGNMTQVYSSYELEMRTDKGLVTRRGVNSIQLLRQNDRWQIMSLTWQEETPELPVLSGSVTKIVLVRHAEKVLDGSEDPSLTEAGQQRAERLKFFLTDMKIDKFYSTKYKRNVLTLMPLAKSRGLNIDIYEAWDKDFPAWVLKENAGKNIVISAHSNTAPILVNTWLGKEQFAQLPDEEYGKIWVLTFQNNQLTDCSVFNY